LVLQVAVKNQVQIRQGPPDGIVMKSVSSKKQVAGPGFFLVEGTFTG
jgi:hypothetical protein